MSPSKRPLRLLSFVTTSLALTILLGPASAAFKGTPAPKDPALDGPSPELLPLPGVSPPLPRETVEQREEKRTKALKKARVLPPDPAVACGADAESFCPEKEGIRCTDPRLEEGRWALASSERWRKQTTGESVSLRGSAVV